MRELLVGLGYRLPKTQKAAGIYAQKAHLMLAIVNEQIINVPDILACFVQDATAPHVFLGIRHHQLISPPLEA